MFKVGNIVIGNNKNVNRYSTTTKGTKWRIKKVISSEQIQVESLDNSNDNFIVISKYFDLYDGTVSKVVKAKGKEVFLFINNSGNKDWLTALNPDTGEILEHCDNVILFNASFKRLHGKRGFIGTPALKYNKSIRELMNMSRGYEAAYKKDRFIKPHYIYSGTQPKSVWCLTLKDNKIFGLEGEYLNEYELKEYTETQWVEKPAKVLGNTEEDILSWAFDTESSPLTTA